VADDVAQEAFIRAYQALDRFDPSRPFGPWIGRIAANLAVNHVRSPEAREDPLPRAPSRPPRPRPDRWKRCSRASRSGCWPRPSSILPVEQRAVFVLRAVEELSLPRDRGALDISIGTVMSRCFRAREKLRQTLAPYLASP